MSIFIACQKTPATSPGTPVTPSNPTPVDSSNVKKDSIFLLTSIGGNFDRGTSLMMEYDNKNRLNKLYVPYTWAVYYPCYIVYKSDHIDHIVAVGSNGVGSLVFQYGPNQNIVKVYYKYLRSRYDGYDSSKTYWGDITDGQYGQYDTLTYSASGQLMQIHKFSNTGSGFSSTEIIKLYYADLSDTTLNKIEKYPVASNGTPVLDDQLLLTTNSIRSPAHKFLWFFPYLSRLTNYADDGSLVFDLPLLFDAPSTSLDMYCPLATHCIVNYKVYNSWGLYNYTGSVLNYGYSPDSLNFYAEKHQQPDPLSVKYSFQKVKK
jgi:hypothetical protein